MKMPNPALRHSFVSPSRADAAGSLASVLGGSRPVTNQTRNTVRYDYEKHTDDSSLRCRHPSNGMLDPA
jgi:hypothetical protein